MRKMNMMKKLTCMTCAIAMAVVGLVGCGNSAGSAGAGDAGTSGSGTVASVSEHDPDTVTIAFSSEPASMTWWDNEEMPSIYSAYLTNSFLMKIDPDTMEPVPDLAESVETLSDSEYVFHLRQGVYFHHGKEFKAEDVVATYNLIVQYPGSSPYVSSIQSVEALDDYTVKFTMDGPYPNLLYDVAYKYSIDQAAAAIYKAKHPVILAGHSAVRNRAGEALTSFADTLRIPVVNTMMAKGIIPYNNKYSLWTIGIPQKDYQNKVLDMADLVIAVGYDIVEFAPGKWNQNGKHKIIHIDQRPAHINMLFQPEAEVIGDISYSLQQIQYRCDPKDEPVDFIKLRKEMVEEYESYADDNSFPMKPQKILYDIRKFMGESDIVISDVGAHKMWIAREYNCYEPNTCIISNGFATMGIAVPGAVAAKLINPDKKVLAISGDGGFMMNSQEYETALREKTPIVTLIFSDASYGLIKWKQMDHFGHNCFVDFENPDFVKYAESMHAKGYRVKKAEDLIPILQDAFQQKIPCIIDCPVDYSENVKLSEYLHQKFET